MAAPETFDPKRYTPFEGRRPPPSASSVYLPVDPDGRWTGVRISQGLEHVRVGDGPGRR